MPVTVSADHPGRVVAVHVVPGDAVADCRTLLTVDDCGLHLTVAAGDPGIIVAVHVSAGDRIEPGQPLVDISTE